MKKLKGWPVLFTGVALLSTGSWINSGADAGLIVAGLCLIVSGFLQWVTA